MLLLVCYYSTASELKTWKNSDSSAWLELNSKKLESYYKQVDKQSKQRNFVIFNGKRVISHDEFAKFTHNDVHTWQTYIVLSEFYISWVSPHSDLGGISVGGILSNEINEKKPRIRYFKFAQRYYQALSKLGKGAKVYSYCAAPYITSCILIGINEKW